MIIDLFHKLMVKIKSNQIEHKIKSSIQLNHEEILVAIGIIINPIWLKKVILIKIFKRTEVNEI